MPSLFPDLFAFRELAPLLLRIVLAAVFLAHGYAKLFSNYAGTISAFEVEGIKPAKFWAPLLGSVELFGGVLLLVGFLTQLVAILLALDMLAKSVKVRRRQNFVGGYEFELLAFTALLALLVLGPGVYSLDFPF